MKKSTLLNFLIFLFLSFFMFSFQGNAAIIYVDQNAKGTKAGTSWKNACSGLSEALAMAHPGDEIWVAKGVYIPTIIRDINSSGGIDPREASFYIPSGVKLYGGFKGKESSLNQRDWKNNLTILSGDIDNNDINWDENNIAESYYYDIQEANAYHVIFTENADKSTTVDGFIITAGSATPSSPLSFNDPNLNGGGWFNKISASAPASSPSVANTIFIGNEASSQGGAFYSATEIKSGEMMSGFVNCEFTGNYSGEAGGALYIGSLSGANFQPNLLSCNFSGNIAYRRGGAVWMAGDKARVDSSVFYDNNVTALSMDATTLPTSGGGIFLIGSNASFTGCIFKNNHATGNPTGPFDGGGGGAVYITMNDQLTTALGPSQPKFTGCGFYTNSAWGNWGAWGGAVMHLNDGGILKPSFVNCVFNGNYTQFNGGAVATYTRVISNPSGFIPSVIPQFTNCTFTQNLAHQSGGAVFNSGYTLNGTEILQSRIENCIFYKDTAEIEGLEIYTNAKNTITYSIVQGSGGSGSAWNTSLGTDGGNNLDVDPDFVNEDNPNGNDTIPATQDDGLRLSESSPAVNSGNNSAPALAGITMDYTGLQRIQNSVIDRGAYERAGKANPVSSVYNLSDWHLFSPCKNCPTQWSFDLLDRVFQQFKWDGPAQLTDDGKTAIIKGRIVAVNDKKAAFNVQIKLVNPYDWNSWNAKQRTYYTLNPLVWKTAFQKHNEWKYWELSPESYLEGLGSIAGVLKLKHQPFNYRTGFQLGEGANALNKENGLQGFFGFSGTLKYKGKNVNMNGLGTMNVDASYCSACEKQGLLKSALDRSFTEEPLVEKIDQEQGFEIYPIPANDNVNIRSASFTADNWEIFVYDVTGVIKKQVKFTSGEEFILPVNDLKPGVYSVKLQSGQGKVIIKKLVITR